MSISLSARYLSDGLSDEIDDGSSILDDAEQVLSTVTYDSDKISWMTWWDKNFDTGEAAVSKVQDLLNQFWTLKAANYADYDSEGQAAWNEQDSRAHQIWGRLEEKRSNMSDSKAEIDAHAATAAEAYGKAATLAAAANSASLAKSSANLAHRVPGNAATSKQMFQDTSYSAAFSESAKNLISAPVFGIPMWVWLTSAVGVVVFLRVKK